MLGMFQTNTPTEPPAAPPPRAPRRDVPRHREPYRCPRDRHHEPELLAAPRPEPLAVAPRGELEAPGLADAYQVVAAPADQRDLVGRGRHAAVARGARQGLDALQAVVERRQVPAGAPWTDHPQPPLPLVEREPASHPEVRGAAVTVELAVAEGAGPIHRDSGLGTRGSWSRRSGRHRAVRYRRRSRR